MGLQEDVKTILVDAGVGSTSSTGVTWRIVYREFVSGSQVATSAGGQLAITETGGFAEWEKSRLQWPTFQIRGRAPSTGSTGLEDKMNEVLSVLDHYTGTPNDVPFTNIGAQSPLLYLGRDGNERPMYSLNFLAYRQDSPEIFFEWRAGNEGGTFTRVTSTSAPATYAVNSDVGEWGTLTTAKTGERRLEWVST